jgi:hypothetical protein
MFLQSILDCISGTLAANPPRAAPTGSRATTFIASDILTILLTADTPYILHKQLNEQISTESWSEAIASALLHGLEIAIKTGAQMAKAASNALAQARDAAIGFAKENPVYVTLTSLLHPSIASLQRVFRCPGCPSRVKLIGKA